MHSLARAARRPRACDDRRAALVEQATCQRVAQRMGAAVCQADTVVGIADHASDSIDADRFIARRQATNEHGRVGGLRPLVAQIARQRSTGARRQRQDVLAMRLRAPERDGAGTPVDVGQLQLSHLAAAQSQVQCAAHDGVAAPRCGQRSRKRSEQTVDFSGLERARQGAEAPVGGCGDYPGECMHSISAGHPVPKIRAQPRGERDGVRGSASKIKLPSDELPQLLRLQLREHDRPVGKLVQQQSPRDMQAPAPCAFRHSLNIAHILIVAAQLILDGTGRPRRLWDRSLVS